MTDDDLVAIVLENKISKDDQYYQLLNVGVQSVENEHTATITLSGRNNEKNLEVRVKVVWKLFITH